MRILQVYIIIFLERKGFIVFILDLEQDAEKIFNSIWNPIKDFLLKVWNDINDFLLHYMPQDIINMFLIVVVAGVVLFVLLAIINRE